MKLPDCTCLLKARRAQICVIYRHAIIHQQKTMKIFNEFSEDNNGNSDRAKLIKTMTYDVCVFVRCM